MFYLYAFIISVLLFLLAMYSQKDKVKERMNQKNNLSQLVNNITGNNKSFINAEYTKAIVLDETDKKVYIFSPSENKELSYKFIDIIQSEVLIDDDTIISTNRGSQLAGAIVGGLIAGVSGAIVGSLSGIKISKKNIKSIELKLTINDMENSIFKINFLSPINNSGWSKDSSKVKNALTIIEEWQGYLDIIFKQQNNVI